MVTIKPLFTVEMIDFMQQKGLSGQEHSLLHYVTHPHTQHLTSLSRSQSLCKNGSGCASNPE